MRFLNDAMQAVVIIVCEKHAPALLDTLHGCPEGNWFVMPPVADCRMGYWPHVSAPHAGGGYAVWGFAEHLDMARMLSRMSSVNEDGSLCPDCVAYSWNITPLHMATSVPDPVCGKKVSCGEALSRHHDGRLFFFCSMGCRDSFIKSPERYLSVPDGVVKAR